MVLNDYYTKEVQEILLYLFIGVFVTLFLPLAAGFSFKGFQESLTSGLIHISAYLGTFLVYLFFIVVSLFLIIYPIASLLTIKKDEHPATQKKPTWFRIFTVSYIFNPEDGMLWQISEAIGLKGEKNFMNWSRNILRVIVISILLFGTLGLIQVANPEFNVVGTPSGQQLAQQITPTSDVIFGSAIPSFSENGFLCFILFLLLGITAYCCARFIKDKKTALITFFFVGLFIISPLMGLFWMSLHSILYGNSDASLLATFIFGYLGSVLTIITGVFISWFIWHFMNNFFIKLSELITATEDIFFITIVVLAILAIVWGSIEFLMYRYKGRKKNNAG